MTGLAADPLALASALLARAAALAPDDPARGPLAEAARALLSPPAPTVAALRRVAP